MILADDNNAPESVERETPMKSQVRSWMLTISVSAAVGAFLFWFIQLIWQKAGEIDSAPSRYGFKNQVMHRKSKEMHDILDDMVAGDLERVQAAATRMKRYGNMISGFLKSESYDKYSVDFQQSVGDLTTAAGRNDFSNAQDAVLRLEKSCIECHQLLNNREIKSE